MNVLIADDHEIVREGLALLIKDTFPVSSLLFASDGQEAIQKATKYPVDLVVLDLSMPGGLDGMLALRELRRLIATGKIIVFSMYDEIELQQKAYRYGADGYLIKQLKSESIIEAIQQILDGKKLFPDVILSQETEEEKTVELLSPREQEVLYFTINGYSQKEIAKTMFISVRTVENHRRNIRNKLGSTDKRVWLEYARKHQLLNPV